MFASPYWSLALCRRGPFGRLFGPRTSRRLRCRSFTSARSELEAIALEFDVSSLAGNEALRVVDELGAIRRVVDGMLAKTAKRVADTSAHAAKGDRNAAAAVARSLGVGAGEVRSPSRGCSKQPDTASFP